MVGYLTLLQEEPDLSPEMRARYTGVALDKALRLEDLINEFFEITRFNLSAIELERERVDVSRMLEQMMWEFKPLMADKNLEWQAQLPPKVLLSCDPGKMERVLDNLISNAVKYGRPGGAIALSAEEYEKGLVIQVSDNGKGISPQALGHVFDSFFRADTARTSSVPGSGLGLAICRSIVESHHGKIWLTSEEGEGTRAFLYLPLQKEEGVLR